MDEWEFVSTWSMFRTILEIEIHHNKTIKQILQQQYKPKYDAKREKVFKN